MPVKCPACSTHNVEGARFCSQCATPIPPFTATGAVSGTTPAPGAGPTAPVVAPGQLLLGKYRVERVLGKGALGIVYEAVDTFIGRRVAVKTIKFGESTSDERARAAAQRFAREARAAGRLTHPNIVVVDAAGEAEGLSYMVMELKGSIARASR